jgi:hypothetical protein
LEVALNETGEKTISIVVAPEGLGGAIAEATAAAIGDNTSDMVILKNSVDNSFFAARTEDGHFGQRWQIYHVDREDSHATYFSHC